MAKRCLHISIKVNLFAGLIGGLGDARIGQPAGLLGWAGWLAGFLPSGTPFEVVNACHHYGGDS